MSDAEPIQFSPRGRAGNGSATAAVPSRFAPVIHFDRRELEEILRVYGRRVAAGDWRDYALDFGSEKAVFSVFRRSSEMPIYRIVRICVTFNGFRFMRKLIFLSVSIVLSCFTCFFCCLHLLEQEGVQAAATIDSKLAFASPVERWIPDGNER